MAKIKICGIRRMEDMQYINRAQPDFAGFILSRGFRRSVAIADACQLVKYMHGSIKKVGVFVDEPEMMVNKIVEVAGIDLVQLHGNESPSYCASIKVPVIKVLKPSQFDMVDDYEPYVDYFLFDSGTGTGRVFDWNSIPSTSKPFFLAGGLDFDNIEDAIKNINPYAVDLSSSVETNGYKDYDKIKKIVDIVRRTK